MNNKAKLKQYTCYVGVLPEGYYFNGKKAVPKEETKPTENSKYIGKATPVICMPDGTIQPFNMLNDYYLNDKEIDRDVLLENGLQVENGRVTNRKYKQGGFAMPWKLVICKPKNVSYDVKYLNNLFYVRDDRDKITAYKPSLFKTMFNNKGFEKELEDVGTISVVPEPLFEIRKSSKADFADRVMYKLNNLYEKSFYKVTLEKLPEIERKDENTVQVNNFEIHKGKTFTLKESDETVVETDNEKELMAYAVPILGYFANSTLNNFLQQPITNEEYTCLYDYTTDDYIEINAFLRKKDKANLNSSDYALNLSFSHYLEAVKIHEILQKSKPFKNMYLFRGLSLRDDRYKKIKEGYVLADDGFKSTSFSSDVSTMFLPTSENHRGILCLIDCKNTTNCLYIHNLADTQEYETLIDINYDLKFVKELGTFDGVPVWLTETVRNPSKIDNYLYQPDALEKVLNILQSDNKIKKLFYIALVDDDEDESKILLNQIFNEENTVRITVTDKEVTVGDQKIAFDDVYFDFDLLQVVYAQKKESEPDEIDVWQINQRISQNLVSLLLANNIVIQNQEVNRDKTHLQIYVDDYTSENDLSTLTVEFNYRVDKKDIYLSFECNLNGDLKKSTETKITHKNIDLMAQAVYNFLMHNYILNCERRLKHIVKLVGGYYMSESKIERYNNGYKAEIGDKLLFITKSGNSLKANNLTFNYADNIYDIATAIKEELNM